jgi:hypothetical protein
MNAIRRDSFRNGQFDRFSAPTFRFLSSLRAQDVAFWQISVSDKQAAHWGCRQAMLKRFCHAARRS